MREQTARIFKQMIEYFCKECEAKCSEDQKFDCITDCLKLSSNIANFEEINNTNCGIPV